MEELVTKYLNAKAAEDAAKQARLAAESELVQAVANDKMEGSKTTATPDWKITVSNKLTRSLDYQAYQSISATLPPNLQFVDLKPEINLTKLRHVEAIDPAIVAQCVTVKPAKPSITIKPMEA